MSENFEDFTYENIDDRNLSKKLDEFKLSNEISDELQRFIRRIAKRDYTKSKIAVHLLV